MTHQNQYIRAGDRTEWVNSYVIVEKEVEIDTANAHSPSYTIKKKI